MAGTAHLETSSVGMCEVSMIEVSSSMKSLPQLATANVEPVSTTSHVTFLDSTWAWILA